MVRPLMAKKTAMNAILAYAATVNLLIETKN